MKKIPRRDDLIYPELSYEIIGCAYEVFKELGYGHSESVYQKAMAKMFNEKHWKFEEQVYTPVKFHNELVGKRVLDFVVDEKIVVELKRISIFLKRILTKCSII